MESRFSGRRRWHEGISNHQLVASIPKFAVLFAASGEIAANAGKDLSAVEGAEAAGDF